MELRVGQCGLRSYLRRELARNLGTRFRHAAGGQLIEDFLKGKEASFFALVDGKDALPLGTARDFKRLGDGDTGPNTGGMGAYSPPYDFPIDMYDQVRERILGPVLRGLLAEGESYIGVLYLVGVFAFLGGLAMIANGISRVMAGPGGWLVRAGDLVLALGGLYGLWVIWDYGFANFHFNI